MSAASTATSRCSRCAPVCGDRASAGVLVRALGAGTQVGAFALTAEEAQHLDGAPASAAEPVRDLRTELGGLAGLQDQVLVAQHKPELPVQDVEPLVTLMRLQRRRVTTRGDDQLVR